MNKKVIAVSSALLLLLLTSGCAEMQSTRQVQGLKYDPMQYAQVVGMRWMSNMLIDSCKDEPIILTNLKVLRGKADELKIYVDHKHSSSLEKRQAEDIVTSVETLVKQYRETRNETACKVQLTSMVSKLDILLDEISGKQKSQTYVTE